MRHRSALLLAAAFAALALPAAAQTAVPASAATPTATPAANTPAATLRKLFNDSDEATLARNPIQGLFRGDMRRADQFGDYISDAYLAAEKKAAEDDLKALAAIDRSALNANDKVSYDVFKWQRSTDLKGFDPALLAATVVRPIDHFTGFHTFFPELSSGEGAAPFKTVKDYEDSLKRTDGFIKAIDASIVRFRQGMKSGVVQPKLVVQNVIDQLNNLLAPGVDEAVMMKPVAKFPATFSANDQTRLKAAYTAEIGGKVNPALTRLRDFLKNEYLPVARSTTGLSEMPGGPALYKYQIAATTTTDLTADQIHAIGLSEVARITKGMEAVKAQVGYKGTNKEFFEFIRTDPQFKPKSKQDLTDRYYAVGKRVDAVVGNLFSTIPKTSLEIRPVPAFKEKTDAGGSYQGGTPDGSRPGVFYFNTYDLPSRTTPGIETLYLHEGVPGHHFQISLAQENESLPPFQRFGGNTAYVEGWALYAESLGPELGMFKDPYQLQGRYDDEMLRAMRLVVDTGLHSKRWTRDQSIQYMLDHSAMGKSDATSEVERYIAMPSQALAYKLGQLTISRLRAKAEKELGPKFDIKQFHEQVLMTGALPMAVLEQKINDWIATKKA
ncbi:hypothetical protein GCM10011529_26030 [Polymorphobacter glacialis]|uniref:DUF885 domain-containing protein n=1 Tax=Sandarakinorhabdus glacialis TaxID=1614636 RepID=A0A917EBD2_9SPHN|nr:DUF885 domain-containing protein [Polymorphobacter glacialis]GGE18387.1 hypothetical protein GCM10011529_26030 [Polymorphobacter glacialis]